ncbi:MAG: glycosyltransferase family 8 protein [Puniceicoccales bacterium]|jgi:lipopolysaccharide biosynthesis glycosyltransferase|nr:glycosyltransferase family 8 protein [Puniceicoccales bacterium]
MVLRGPVNIAFSFDDKFHDIFKVAVHSIAKNTASDLSIYVVDCGISDAHRRRIAEFISHYGNILSLKFGLPKRVDAIERLPIPENFSSAIFYRLAIPKIFPDLKRVIYLDCDIIAGGDIADLWNEDLGNCAFGAIEEDENFFRHAERRTNSEKLGMPDGDFYYSSGVLLIDCCKFEKSDIFGRVIDLISRTKIRLHCPEQDAMNMCLRSDEHRALSPKYNFMPYAPLAKSCLKKIRNPTLVHLSCFKPWHLNGRLVKAFHSLGFFKYSAGFSVKFWQYAGEIGVKACADGNVWATLKFFHKRTFQPLERAISKGLRDNFLNLLRKFVKLFSRSAK